MPATAAGHPPASVLAAFALGKLDGPAAETVHAHLAGCQDCRTVVETTPSDSLMALFQQAAGAGNTPAPSKPGAITRGTRLVSNPDFDAAALPPELRDHPRYRIVRKLGQGGMGAVYLAEHKLMKRVVAVKMIASDLVNSPEAAERFQREVQAAARLDHRNIVRAYDADRAGGMMLLAMEFVTGRTLADVVASKGPLPVAYACQCVRQAAHGLQHAADRGMVHRDIKPQNLMLTDTGVVKILDFGLAKLASERKTRAGLTGTDVVMGTPEYIAPEQARDTAAADIRADIYSLGCTLFCLLTGKPPFAGDTPIETMTKHVTDTPPAVTDVRPDVPAGLADVVGRMLAKDPAARPQTPREVAEALAAFAKPGGKTPPPIPAGSVFAGLPHVTMSMPRPRAAKPRWRLAVTGVGVAAIVVALAIPWVGDVFRPKAEPPVTPAVDNPKQAAEHTDGRAPTPAASDGFVPLFNGKDLSDWTVVPTGTGNWEVVDGAITCVGPQSYLFTRRSRYANFHFRAEAAINRQGNSGIYFRCQFQRANYPNGYEMEIRDGPADMGALLVINNNKFSGLLRGIDPPVGSDQWATYEVIAAGNRLSTRVNGQLAAEYEDASNSYSRGHIALQHHGPMTRVRFRKIEIKELP